MSPENKDEANTEFTIQVPTGIVSFLIKTIIICVTVAISIGILVSSIPKIPETEQNKLIWIGFIQNPNVLWKLSILEEQKGNFKKAINYMELAIGLMEMNGASEKYLNKYEQRLKLLESKI